MIRNINTDQDIAELWITTPGILESVPLHELEDILRDNDTLDPSERKLDTYNTITRHARVGRTIKLLIQWDTGFHSWEDLDHVVRHDPMTVAEYAEKNGLLDTHGWKRLNRIYGRRKDKVYIHGATTKNRISNKAPKYKFGVAVPRNTKEAYLLDEQNGNLKWTEAIKTETELLWEFGTFQVLQDGARVPLGYKRVYLTTVSTMSNLTVDADAAL